MTLSSRIAAQSIPADWQRVAGAAAAWFRADGATLHRDTYQPTWTATRRRSVGTAGVEARGFYTVEAALAWIGSPLDRFPALDLTGAVLS